MTILCAISKFIFNNVRFYLLTFDDRNLGSLIDFFSNYKFNNFYLLFLITETSPLDNPITFKLI